jgi:tetratricopeptide (TPR) repeat protein
MDVNSDVKELKNKGNVFYQAQNYQEAIDVYTQALSLDSKNSTLYSNRSAAFSKLSRYNEATKCIQHSRNWSKGYYRKVVALEGLNNYPDIMEAAEDGVKYSDCDGQMKKEFVKKWLTANQNLHRLPPNSIELPRGICILSQKYLDVLVCLMRSLEGECPINTDMATKCVMDCIEQIVTLLKSFGEPIEDAQFLYDWGSTLICDIYPSVPIPSNKNDIENLLLGKTEEVVCFFEQNIDSSFYPLIRPIFALITLVVLNRTNILTESNSGHCDAELMNRAIVLVLEAKILNTCREYRYLYIGRLCAVLDSFIGRSYILDKSEMQVVTSYREKLVTAISNYPTELPDHQQYKLLSEKSLANIDNVLLNHKRPVASFAAEEITTSNAISAIEFGRVEAVKEYISNRYRVLLQSIEYHTMGEVEELISMTEILLKLNDRSNALNAFRKGEELFFIVLGRLMETNAIKIDQCSTTIAPIRQYMFNYAKMLQDPHLFAEIAIRWKCSFTNIRNLFIHFGLAEIFSKFFDFYKDCITDVTKSNEDSAIIDYLQRQLKQEESLLCNVSKRVMQSAYNSSHVEIANFLDASSIVLDYAFYVPLEDESVMEATCVVLRNAHDPVIIDLNYSQIRLQSERLIHIITQARKLYWNSNDISGNSAPLLFDLKILTDLLFPDALKQLLVHVNHIYVSAEGSLALIPFGMLPIDMNNSDQYMPLGDVVSLSLLGSVHHLYQLNNTSEAKNTDKLCYVFADPNFNCQAEKPASFFNNMATLLFQYLKVSESSGSTLDQLQHSESEADFISYYLCSSGFKVQQWMHDEANLKNFMSLCQPFILHLSTHAYSQTTRVVSRGNFYLDLNCGFALAGFNTVSKKWYDHVSPDCSLGKIPALAVLSMDLQHTKLVYLSTCNSGTGMVSYQEEIVSLSSAFLTAGAETVIATLWPVKDESAALFCKYFYDHLLNSKCGTRPSQALAYAKRKLSEDSLWSHWCHWSGYTCYGLDLPVL